MRAASALDDFEAVVKMARPAIDSPLEHMRREEEEFLNPDLLRDDVIDINQSDG